MSTKPKSIVWRALSPAAAVALAALVLVPAKTQGAIRIAAERVAGGFVLPDYVGAPPGDTSRLFVAQKTGEIFRKVQVTAGSFLPGPVP